MKDRVIFLADMQSFYASVEKGDHPDLRDKPVIVSGDPERRSGIILAACPIAKSWGVETAEALWQAQQKCPHAVVVRPRMQRYIDVSCQITAIFEEFTDLVEPYSIDEQFLDVTGSRRLFGDPLAMAQKVQQRIMEKTGVYARIGIGPNKVMAKMACDNFAKKNENGIFWLTRDKLETHLWPLPVHKMFGVGSRMKRHLNNMGIRTIGQLARFPLEKLKRKWGIPGHILWMTANGLDASPVTPGTHDTQKAVGHQMTLPRDYADEKEIKVVLLELSEEVGRRARMKGYAGKTVAVGCRGADFDVPTGFYRQQKLDEPTNDAMDIYQAASRLFDRFWDRLPIRSIGVTLTQLQSDEEYQLTLFDNQYKKRQLGHTVDMIREKYGATAVIRAVSLLPAGQALDRAEKIGGHYK
ncbi:MAG: DNA polymerase IV [Bacillaceae bacterium]|nr:DNA polymerase IV [Bacillaceae bacterium]